MTENENISEIIMSKMFDEHLQVNIDYEWRKVVCLDDIGSILRRELKKLNEEIQQYRSIGTVSECREAMEKQRAKKPKYEYLKSLPNCPNCGEVNLQRENEYGNVVENYSHCPDCGQAIDWSDTP